MNETLKSELDNLYTGFRTKKDFIAVDSFSALSVGQLNRESVIQFCKITSNSEVLIVGSSFLSTKVGQLIDKEDPALQRLLAEKLQEANGILGKLVTPREATKKITNGTMASVYRKFGLVDLTKEGISADYSTQSDHNIEVIGTFLRLFRDVLEFFGEVGSLPKLYLTKPDKFGHDVILVRLYEDTVSTTKGFYTQQYGCRLKDKAGNRYDFILPSRNHENAQNIVMKEFNVVGRGRDEEYLPLKRIYDGDKLCGYVVKHTIDDQSREELMGRAVALGVCNRGLIPTCSVDKSSNVLRGRQIKMGDLPKVQKSDLQPVK